jgi:putative transposase
MAYRWDVGEVKRRASRVLADTVGEKPTTQCRHRRLTVGQDYRVGGEQRGYDGGKKTRGRKRHLLVDTEGLVLKVKVHSAKVPDQDGLKLLLDWARTAISGLKHLWLDAGYEGRGKRWVEEVLGLNVEIIRRPPKPIPEEVARTWAAECAKESKKVDWQKLIPPCGFVLLLRRLEVERTFS